MAANNSEQIETLRDLKPLVRNAEGGRRIEHEQLMSALGHGNVIVWIRADEKERAKEEGARWNAELFVWYCHYSTLPKSDFLSARVSSFNPKAAWPELVPQTAWYANLRKILKAEDWKVLSKSVTSSGICWNCGGRGSSLQKCHHPLEAHEEWEYDDETHTQKLVRIVSLCPDCHLVRHMGFANVKGLGTHVTKRFAALHSVSFATASKKVDEEFKVWQHRSRYEWKHDLSWLSEAYPDMDFSYIESEKPGSAPAKVNYNTINENAIGAYDEAFTHDDCISALMSAESRGLNRVISIRIKDYEIVAHFADGTVFDSGDFILPEGWKDANVLYWLVGQAAERHNADLLDQVHEYINPRQLSMINVMYK